MISGWWAVVVIETSKTFDGLHALTSSTWVANLMLELELHFSQIIVESSSLVTTVSVSVVFYAKRWTKINLRSV